MKSQIFCPNNRYLEKYGDILTESVDFAMQEDNNIFSMQIPNLSKRQNDIKNKPKRPTTACSSPINQINWVLNPSAHY